MSHRSLAAVLAAIGVLTAGTGAWAQYSYDPSNPDEQGANTRYFGSVKDERGKIVEGVTILVQHAFAFVSDETGRYIGYAPSDISPKTVQIGCAKPGYTFVRMNKRVGSTNQKPWVQADCVLRKAS